MSEFIERSKHAAMTAAVEDHFGTASARTMPGVASGKGFNSGGDAQYNNVDMPFEAGGGLNRIDPSTAGHTVGGLPKGVQPK